VDTGAPLTILDAPSHPGIDAGLHRVDLEAFALRFPALRVAAWSLFGGEAGSTGGIVGGDLLRHFALSLDVRGGRAWLWDPYEPARLPADLGVDAEIALAVDVGGGGTFGLPGDCGRDVCGTVDVPATRVLVRATLEGDDRPVWALVDSGASAVVLSEELLARLDAAAPGRPRLEGLTVRTADGPAEALLTRVWRLRLEGASPGDPAAPVDDVPALVVPGADWFDAIALEVGRSVELLVGGTYLRRWHATFDYPAGALRLAPYRELDHIPPDEYVGVGFSLRRDPEGDWLVRDVYRHTDAEALGLVAGDLVEEIDGTPIAGASSHVVTALLDAYPLGTRVPIGVQRAGEVEPLAVLVEDLLPSFPPP
jgi:hypothetical protein